MKKILVIALLLSGCSEESTDIIRTKTVDQCLRAERFDACMASLPAGPQVAKYNDWDEVVAECDTVAYYQSIRYTDNILEVCGGTKTLIKVNPKEYK